MRPDFLLSLRNPLFLTEPSWQISLTPDALRCSALRLKARLWLAVQAPEYL